MFEGCVVSVEPMTNTYIKKNLSGVVVDAAVGKHGESMSKLDSANLFGRDYRKDWRSTCESENYRAYIPLCKPVFNYAIAGKDAKEICRVLALKSDITNGISKFTIGYDVKNEKFIPRSYVKKDAAIDSYLFGPEIIEHLIDKWDREKAIIDELYRLLYTRCFSHTKAETMYDIGKISKDVGEVQLIAGYYLSDINIGALKETVEVSEIRNIFLQSITSHKNRLYVILNTTRERLKTAVTRFVVVVPLAFRADMNNRVHSMNKQYKVIRRANNDMKNYIANGHKSLTTYLAAYEDLNDKVNYLLFRHDNLNAPKSLGFTERLSGKTQLLRGKLISKRSDYTGRGVVVCNPNLKLTEIAIPDSILAKVLSHELIKKLNDPEQIADLKAKTDKDIVDMMEKYGLVDQSVAVLNRAPTLHRLSMLAYDVRRASTSAIEVNTLLNEGYNMDHDGDTSAIKIAITLRAKEEVESLLHASHNLFKPSDGSCTLTPRLDMIYGLNQLTKNYTLGAPIATVSTVDVEEGILSQQLKVWDTVSYNGERMTAGKAYLDGVLPKGVYNRSTVITSKTARDLVESLLEVTNNDEFLEYLWKVSKIGFDIARLYPPKMTIISNLNRKHVLKPFKKFYDNVHQLDEANDLGFCTEEDYELEFSEYLDTLKNFTDDAVLEEIEGSVSPAVLMLNGLYMTTRDKYKLDRISDDDELTSIDSAEELASLIVQGLIPVNDTIIYRGERCLAGRKLVELEIGKKITGEITAKNINSYLTEDVKNLGLQLARLFSDIDIDDEIKEYRDTRDTPVLNALYELSKDADIDMDCEDNELINIDNIDTLENNLMSKTISPTQTVIYKNSGRYTAGRLYLTEKSGIKIFRAIDEYSAQKYFKKDLIEIGKKFKSTFNVVENKELEKYVSEEYRNGSGTVYQANGFNEVVVSGARGKATNLVQIFIFKGQIAKANGRPFSAIIENCFLSDLSPLEHLTASYGSRKGVIAKSILPKYTGYLERMLWHPPEDMVITSPDCGTTEGIEFTLNVLVDELKDIDSDMTSRLDDAAKTLVNIITGRCIVGHGDYLRRQDAKRLVASLSPTDKVVMRSPTRCSNPCCAKCYGVDLTNRGIPAVGTPIGIIASESIGEPGTQLTLKAFQKGGLASRNDSEKSESARLTAKFTLSDITDVTKHPEYDPVAWGTGKTIVTEIDNTFNKVSIEGFTKSVKLYSDVEVKEHVQLGEPMCRIPGDQDIKEKERYAGIDSAQRMLVLSTYLIFKAVASVNIKHFEVITASLRTKVVLENNSNRQDIKVLQVYTNTEWRRKNITKSDDILYRETLVGVKTLPKVRESCMCNFLMEDVVAGLRRSILTGNQDDLSNPINATVMGLVPKVGTGYNPNYIRERLEYEKGRLDV